ncbi:hypothetical protein OV207_20745, partial [Corallococcus sp. BB11-1]|uniref:hypothetical protein n=1 Tax=Corallococcus sp. BB11-1 TaxID=2996783 RepID=UPI00226F949D
MSNEIGTQLTTIHDEITLLKQTAGSGKNKIMDAETAFTIADARQKATVFEENIRTAKKTKDQEIQTANGPVVEATKNLESLKAKLASLEPMDDDKVSALAAKVKDRKTALDGADETLQSATIAKAEKDAALAEAKTAQEGAKTAHEEAKNKHAEAKTALSKLKNLNAKPVKTKEESEA